MNNAVYHFKEPQNEEMLGYLPGSVERKMLEKELDRQSSDQIEIPLIIGGKEIKTGKTGTVVMPHNHGHILATYHLATEKEVNLAVAEALKAKESWMNLSWVERSSIMYKAADLISKKYRFLLNAATMLGQGKNAFQAEIDAACEVIDYLRFNAYYVSQIYSEQPSSGVDNINRLEYRPLEGFIYTISPFNFTAIASNLNASVSVMGNTTVWKPATTALLSNYYLMRIFHEAGLPDGAINFVPGSGSLISNVVLNRKELAGIHFTGSTKTFNSLWKTTSDNVGMYRSFPKLVGETGGKDFIFAHNSANPLELAVAIVRGGFEYQGQKCSATSRVYIPKSLWNETKKIMIEMVSEMKIGDVRDFNNFVNAVIDENSFDRIMNYIHIVKNSSEAEILIGGEGDKSNGYFIKPTVLVTTNPYFITMEEEIFGPVITIYVYEDKEYEKTLIICDNTSPYALTGAIFSNDKYAMIQACKILRYSAGNFYINDKPSGAMIGQQPFGGARASGTNDKAGSYLNLLRWISPRTIKETFLPATDFRYPYMK
ncbi:MAG: 1-pyrroline-5-carboxylate dehydrogenase [Bacteroidetes bacterium RIFOXYA12_FULL_35_11]|nr:MAG: 1-pyrroline-5-carboxylate dehydrogenase [Bacteroidetes bacterium GWF2_35_48]OFY77740.1 MAG: 1-pyrroline-5-carboxylate dehydrogenase [Bacteroidetes bacterium RIFOXYA12_FULL_35_11]OFY97904.1 MAG: 1-pyrroline-5-carboxylate dehydrogenase [Bacteroidetes bacterium RIFOXYB2_FULL_35_7]OFY98408.1 MAG: 1-pyrroline-5-carboxylate dehydrogenase [Bacteroidetes bacterium RIFOXYC12_FULL_35_7]HBX51912.1 1-pyrroline-5-carboxylate dehydrogenase [Bacteroidales bacterium]